MTDTTIPATVSPLRAPLEAAGARWAEVAGREVVRHFGDAAAEYQAVRQTAGFAERADRARFRLWGKDPARMLHGLITNDLLKAPAGQGVYAAMLTPKGRTLADLRAFRRDVDGAAELIVDIAREALEGTRDHLKKFVPPMFAKWAEATDSLIEIGVYGPRSAELLAAVLGTEIPADLAEDAFVEPEFAGARLLVAATREAGLEAGFDVFVPAEQAAALWAALAEHGTAIGARPVGFGTLETLRIEAGRPRYGIDITEETIPTEAYQEAGLMERAISFTKGCYTGQEVIIRIAHRGHVNRHLRGLLLADSAAPSPRTPLFNPENGRESGWVTSAAFSPRMGQTIAMGYARRELEPGATVRLGAADGPEARVVALPFGRE
ncbi:aminomethyl transferase family protein [Longimicrobium terrae]|uniref:Folate-binding protein YgfZ n=1 Tax=Longimicrobium terrae TaxID=1639882 RepID=A0A841H362_9BACT|nr:aminomethyl transferase family protein [Longimicrobium terrae]MBB4638307.1 folate-binding protein YgfZ [Longimicrobium terrae]MBB6072625.1 folate-binding protein YgfZ [Longimicrobium terrae]NNC28596.1 aminomethyl transferase family protein [Longimicrobium terrae]